MQLTYLVPAVLTVLPSATAWGTLGHRTTAAVASLYFTPEAHHFTNILLNGQELTEAALFPDKIRYIPSFHYTAPWHYIDAHDDPPHKCGVNITRDCLPADGGCVVSAIANHTARVLDADQNLVHWERGQSLRFMLHFFGDVHQPLHTENMDRGGNEILVRFDGHKTNLHSVWDTMIANKHALTNFENETLSAFTWAENIIQKAEDGDIIAETVDGVCIDDAADCSLGWASEVNGWVCKYVFKDGKDGVMDQELAGDYFEGAVPIIEELILKGGRRLAAWTNKIAAEAGEYEQRLRVQDL